MMTTARPATAESPTEIAEPTIVVQQTLPPPDGHTKFVDLMVGMDNPRVVHRFGSWKRAIFGRYDVFHAHWPELLIRGDSRTRRFVRRRCLDAFLSERSSLGPRSSGTFTTSNRTRQVTRPSAGLWPGSIVRRISTSVSIRPPSRRRIDPSSPRCTATTERRTRSIRSRRRRAADSCTSGSSAPTRTSIGLARTFSEIDSRRTRASHRRRPSAGTGRDRRGPLRPRPPHHSGSPVRDGCRTGR